MIKQFKLQLFYFISNNLIKLQQIELGNKILSDTSLKMIMTLLVNDAKAEWTGNELMPLWNIIDKIHICTLHTVNSLM